MSEDANEVLDRFEEEPQKRWFHHWLIVFGPVCLMIMGILFRLAHYPYAVVLIIAGLVTMLLRSGIFFFTKSRSVLEWIYFIGRIAFSAMIILIFLGYRIDHILLLVCSVLFVASTVSLNFRGKKERQNASQEENIEDDY